MGKEIFDFEKTKDLEVTDIFSLIENMEYLKRDEFLPDIVKMAVSSYLRSQAFSCT